MYQIFILLGYFGVKGLYLNTQLNKFILVENGKKIFVIDF